MQQIALGLILIFFTVSAAAQGQKSASNSIPIEEFVSLYAKTSGEKILVDPRTKARVKLYGQSMETLSYDNLEAILSVHSFGTYRAGDYLVVVPLNVIKQHAIELVTEGKQYAANQPVSDVIILDKLCPSELVPILRPLLSPTSHFASISTPRSILLTTSYANSNRIREIVERLESRTEKKQDCKI